MADITDIELTGFCLNQAATIATRLRELRQQSGLTINALANQTGLDQGTITKIESGTDYQYSIRSFLIICWGLGIQPSEALGFVNQRPRISAEEHALILAHRRIYGGIN